MNQARLVFASFPEVKKVVSEIGRPDDGTDTGGFGNTEYFVDLKPKAEWRPVFHENKDELIAAMDREVEETARRGLELLAADRRQRRRDGQRDERAAGGQAVRRRSEDARREGPGDHQRDRERPRPQGPEAVSSRRPAEPELHRRSAAGGPLRHQRVRRPGRGRGGRRWKGRQHSAPGRGAIRRRRALSGAVSAGSAGHLEHPPAVAFGRTRLAGATHEDGGPRRRLRHLS